MYITAAHTGHAQTRPEDECTLFPVQIWQGRARADGEFIQYSCGYKIRDNMIIGSILSRILGDKNIPHTSNVFTFSS